MRFFLFFPTGRTPLHVAVDAHESMDQGTKIVSLGSTRLLLEMGADPTIREPKGGNTALHAAIALNADPALIKVTFFLRFFVTRF